MPHHIQKIWIDKPCQEDWHEMLPENQGKYCLSCQKSVIDFTGMSNEDILRIIAAKDKLCGRFEDYQLSYLNQMLMAEKAGKHSVRKRLGLVASFLVFFSFLKTEAKVKSETVQTSVVKNKAAKDSVIRKAISGYVTDQEGLPISQVSIVLKSMQLSTLTDVKGHYCLNLPDNFNADEVHLIIRFIGFESQELSVKLSENKVYTTKLKPYRAVLGEVVIIK